MRRVRHGGRRCGPVPSTAAQCHPLRPSVAHRGPVPSTAAQCHPPRPSAIRCGQVPHTAVATRFIPQRVLVRCGARAQSRVWLLGMPGFKLLRALPRRRCFAVVVGAGRRLVPLTVKDVAGLVPGAYQVRSGPVRSGRSALVRRPTQQTHKHKRTNTQRHKHKRTNTSAQPHKHTNTNAQTQAHSLKRTNTSAQTQAHKRTNARDESAAKKREEHCERNKSTRTHTHVGRTRAARRKQTHKHTKTAANARARLRCAAAAARTRAACPRASTDRLLPLHCTTQTVQQRQRCNNANHAMRSICAVQLLALIA
jgi:hypothetical protein